MRKPKEREFESFQNLDLLQLNSVTKFLKISPQKCSSMGLLILLWKRGQQSFGNDPRALKGIPPSLLSFLLLLLSCPLCCSYMPPQLKRATQTAAFTLGPRRRQQLWMKRGGMWPAVGTCKSGHSARQGAPPALAGSMHPTLPEAPPFPTSPSLTRLSRSR